MKMFLNLPFIVSILIITVIAISVFHIVQSIIRKKVPHEMLRENHEVGGFIYNAVGILYAVLIAFVVFAIWTDLKDTETKIEQEASDLIDLYYDASVFPDSVKKEIQQSIRDYTRKVTNDEWDLMSEGKSDAEVTKAYIKLKNIYLNTRTEILPNKDALTMSLKNVNEIREFRRHRILSSTQNIPDILWLVLIIGSVIIVVFTFFFSTRNIRHQYFMTALLVFVCVIVLYLIFVLDHPFYGQYKIKPEAFEPLMSIVKNIDGIK